MKTGILGIIVLFFVSISAIFFAGPPAVDEETLIIGTNAEYRPFSYIDDGEIVGFDIDIISEVCRRLGRAMLIKDMPFDALIPAGAVGKVDVIAAGITYTAERAKKVLFTEPYLSGDDLVVIIADGDDVISSLDDLEGLTVVVNEGYTADLYLSKTVDFPLMRLPSPADAFMALKSGRADVFFTAQSTASAFFSHDSNSGFTMSSFNAPGDDYALVVSKKSSYLLHDINSVLYDMETDGTIDKLKEKWSL
ncbi:MAG: amino acid ABC transporter substrate-binding protein [Waddliaceae bacterium]|jgi:arginine/lysine/histidine transporter system substrate-binding protein|nr:amino acid ABC transporter substrate-binding protein [Waddliaceae bacterium]MBT3579563.1 amino acid ABC transporter substrate-binding protein [Waddliaceae bacterium]MBT4444425.1 amino acid ABC transporter substrate-binding protein [Waddliaceae bacterium]MBT6927997.1 amino acid ABC transporter substrate-binding protein [Waddliaceae bacterium]MBT7263887.1 amino acid ABC transporter substrate-binding protein [Waddliaceae bacterium]